MVTHVAETPYTCGWTMEGCCTKLEAAFDSDDTAKVAVAQRALNTAAEILYALSGRQFGICELVVRPCRLEECGPCDMNGPRWVPVLAGGEWTNVSCGRHKACSCPRVMEMALPGPIARVSQVMLNGSVMDPTKYRVDNGRTLVRLDGGAWPTCQNMAAESTEDNTWEVTYERGKPVPIAGQAALSDLACEVYLACIGDGACALPKRVTNISRDGVTYTMLDPMSFIEKRKTGLYLVDLWLNSVNPQARTRGAAILSPDMPPRPRRTGA